MSVPNTKTLELVLSLLPDSITKQLSVNSSDWKSLSAAVNNLDSNDANQVHFLLDLAKMANGDENMVRAISGNTKIKNLRDVALLYNQDDLAAITTSPLPASQPSQKAAVSVARTASLTHTVLATTTARSFHRQLFLKEPTGVLQKMVQDGEILPENKDARDGMLSFFNAHPDFNIRAGSVVPLLKNIAENNSSPSLLPKTTSSVVDTLKNLQRVQALTSDPAAIPILLSAGIKSAQQVAAIPQAHFISDMKLPNDTARDIHRHATDSVIRSNMVLTTALQTVRGTGIAALDGKTTREERIAQAKQMMVTTSPNNKSVVDLEQLFGSMDYCDCGDCNSVTSPASYFVELLQYLRNNNLDPATTSTPATTGWAGTALEKLFRRRPDLADLELTCANTNTVLPYIDLSNEVMESFVVHLSDYTKDTNVPKQAEIQAFNVEANDDSAQLLAQPRNVNYQAYCILKDAVYPFTLPYHQPIDEIRILLGFLKTSRYELLSTFRSALLPGTPDPSDSEIAINRAITAESLLLVQEDYKILTLEAFYSKSYFENVLNQLNMSDSTYQANIGVLQPYAYWGYADANSGDITNADESKQLGLTFVEAQFLPRSGLAYTDLVSLVQTQYVNPDWPKGWALAMLEKIRYSYAFLYSLINTTKSSKQEQLKPVIAWLAKNQPFAEYFEKMRRKYLKDLSSSSSGINQYKHSGNQNGDEPKVGCDCYCCDYCIWKCWVLRYFELFGQLVVLDSRDGPVFGTEGWLILQQLPPVVGPPMLKASVPILTPSLENEPVTPLPTNTVIGYLARDGSVTTTSANSVVTQIGHVAPNCQLIYDSNGKTFVQQYSLDNVTYSMGLYSIDQTTQIGSVDITTDQIDLYPANSNGTINSTSQTTQVQWGPVQDDCNLQNVRLIHLDGSQISADDYGRWQRFLRLWLKLGWTMDQLDQALIGLANLPSPLEGPVPGGSGSGGDTEPPTISPVTWSDLQDQCPCDNSNTSGGSKPGGGEHDKCCKCSLHIGDLWTPIAPLNISSAFLDQLAAVKQLQNLTGLDLSQLLVFWADIGTHSGDTPSLYQTLFLTTSMIALDPVFEADANGNYLTTSTTISAHASAVMAALHINKPIDLSTLTSVTNITDGLLNLSNLSALYRYKLLANVLSLSISQLPTFVAVFGNPFAAGAIQTLEIVSEWNNASSSGFSLIQLGYIIKGIDSKTSPVGPTQLSILKTCKGITDGLSDIRTSYPDPSPTVPVTADLIAAVAGLIFDTVTTSAIQGVLNGTKPWTTNAPTGLNLVIPAPLSKVLKYIDSPATTTSAASATVTSTGILTADKITAAKALVTESNATAWSQTIDRLLKQPVTWFQNTLFGVFSDSVGAIAVLLAGDVPASTPPSSDPSNPTVAPPVPDPGTAPGKMEYFLVNFMPFLRSTLEQQLVTDTMTSVSGLSSDLTALLLNNVLTVQPNGGAKATAMSTLIGLLNEPPETATSSWTGYLVPPSTNSYTFAGIGDTQPANITIGGVSISFPHQQADPNNMWSSDPVKLTAGFLVTLTDPSGPATQLQWKTARSPTQPIPSSALLPSYATTAMSAVFVSMVKAGLIINGFSLSVDEVTYFQNNGADFDKLDFNAITLESWKRLSAYVNLKQLLQGPSATLLVLFQWAVAASTAGTTVDTNTLVQMIVVSTAWDPVLVQAMIDPTRFNLSSPAAYRNEIALTKLSKALAVFTAIGGGGGSNGAIDIPTLFSWALPLTKFDSLRAIAATIRKCIRGSYDVVTWEKAVQPLNNTLREDQKNALIAYLLVQPVLRAEGIIDADSLFEFFLIDVQMSSCLQTSRIKQAISTAQLFIQRCLLGLELDQSGNSIRVNADRWPWMSKYVLWEANRKVFLYPENWLVPSLRDDKSPFYSDLESSLMQKTVNSDAVSDAIKNYLYSLDHAANLLVKGLFLDTPTGQESILHIVSCTRHAPQQYYYRQLDTISGQWASWEIMSVDIPSYTVDATPASSSSTTTSGSSAGSGSSSSNTGSGSSGSNSGSGSSTPPAVVVNESGSYVTPVVWNGRTFVFFPTFAKKSLPSSTVSQQSMTTTGNTNPGSNAAAVQYWYITMNMSERRDGVWTPKQISADGVCEDISTINDPAKTPQYQLPLVNTYVFIPRLIPSSTTTTGLITTVTPASLSIDVLRQANGSFTAVGRFDYVNGRLLRSASNPAIPPAISDPLDFGLDTTLNQMFSWQASSSGSPDYWNQPPYASYPSGAGTAATVQLVWPSGPPNARTTVTTDFYHGFADKLLEIISSTNDIGQLYKYYQSSANGGLPDAELSDAFGGTSGTTKAEVMYSELMQPYAIYNWEPCYHALMELANQMLAQSQFDKALALCQYMFNPMVNSNDPSSAWLFRPFQYIISKDYLENFFNSLQPGLPNNQINEWRKNPYAPYVVARSRPVAFMKALVMLYIQILIAYGDDYFRQNTLETVPLAIQCYVVASHIYGKPGQKIPKRGNTEAETFRELANKLDAFDNAVVDLELMFPFSNQIDTPYPVGFTHKYDTLDLPNIFGSATTHYFCIPQNSNLLQLRATIDDRLFKLRHCQDINGAVQKLPLFEPPLDVGALVAAAALGLSISSVLSDLDSPMPNYRFYHLLQKAHEVVADLKALTQGWLSAKEKEDGEALAILRQQHEININKLMMDVKERSLDEANASLDQLNTSRDTPKYRLQYYLQLLGADLSSVPQDPTQDFSEIDNLFDTPMDDGGLMLIPSEAEQMDKGGSAKDWNEGAGVAEAVAAVFHAIPDETIHTTPIGMGLAIRWGFPWLANASSAAARGIKVQADILSAESGLAGLRTSYLKQRQDRVQQANIAGYELAGIDKQILTQQIRVDIATKDIATQQAQIDNSQDVLTFYQTKYTNQQLYTWLDQQVQTLCYSSYTLAYDLAKRVEKAYHFERPLDTQTYVQYGYWDQSHNGLLVGERLSTALRQIEGSYQSTRGYDYEVTKNVSLRLTQPLQLLALRQTGSCQVELPEILFDMDFPGHYLRRIKAVSLTIPCVTGPYTAVSCTLRLLSHTYRTSSIAKGASDYPQQIDGPDSRFATTNIPISAIATSNGQNDSGLFELDFHSSERYLPFEGAGAISTWSLQLPDSLRQFDYTTISDVVLTIRYTSNDGGAQLQSAASATVAAYVKSVNNLAATDGLFTMWDLKAEFATDWYRMALPLPAGSDPTQRFMTLRSLNQLLPVFAATAKKVTAVDIYLYSTTPLPMTSLSIAPVTTTASGTSLGEAATFTTGQAVRSFSVYQALGADLQVGTWQFAVTDGTVSLERIFLVVRYQLS